MQGMTCSRLTRVNARHKESHVNLSSQQERSKDTTAQSLVSPVGRLKPDQVYIERQTWEQETPTKGDVIRD